MDYQIIRSFRKTLSIQVLNNGEILVRSPYFLSKSKIEKILLKKEAWIAKKLEKTKEFKSAAISKDMAERLRKSAKEYIPQRVEYWSQVTGLSFHNVKITSARSRFGSCNQKGNLCFSMFLMLAEPNDIDYVVLHELCHTKVMNHSKEFYKLVSEYMPSYKESQKRLKEIIIPAVIDEKGI